MNATDNKVEETKPVKTGKPSKREGRRLRTLPAMDVISPFIMRRRNDALNYYSDSLDIGAAEAYIAKKRAEGYTGFGLMHLFLAAYVRVVAEKPVINRFIRGQRVFARNGISICLTIKKEMDPNSPDTVVKFFPKADSTAIDIYNEVNKTIAESKADTHTEFDGLMKALAWMPGFVFRFVIGLFTLMDYCSLLPHFLTRLSPFHAGLFITSMGSLGIPPIYHHIYNFGNVPLFISFGAKYKDYYIKPDGSVGCRRKVDYKITMDERITDGFNYSLALKRVQYYLTHPDKMDVPPAEVVEDIR